MANGGSPVDHPQPTSKFFRDNYNFPGRQPMASGRGFGRGRARGFRFGKFMDDLLRQRGSGFGGSHASGFSGSGGLWGSFGGREPDFPSSLVH